MRIGASMASPDQHLQGTGASRRPQSPVEVVQQLLPPGWEQAVARLDNSVNPLRSNANAQAFLSELHAEWLRQSCGGGGGGQGQRAGSEAPGYDFYLGAKFPGAGTWVRWVETESPGRQVPKVLMLWNGEAGKPPPLSHRSWQIVARPPRVCVGPCSCNALQPILPCLQPLARGHAGTQEGAQPPAGQRRALAPLPHQGGVRDHR